MDDIAARVGVAHGTVYRYFGNKEALLAALVSERIAGVREEALAALHDPSGEGLQRAIRRFLAHVSANRGLARIWSEVTASRSSAAGLRLRLRTPWIEAITVQVRQAQVEGRLPASVDPEVGARALGAMVDNFAYVWFVLEDRPEDADELDKLAETLSILWTGALGAAGPLAAGSKLEGLRAAIGP
jgi:AcrR family transcriptional regulator